MQAIYASIREAQERKRRKAALAAQQPLLSNRREQSPAPEERKQEFHIELVRAGGTDSSEDKPESPEESSLERESNTEYIAEAEEEEEDIQSQGIAEATEEERNAVPDEGNQPIRVLF